MKWAVLLPSLAVAGCLSGATGLPRAVSVPPVKAGGALSRRCFETWVEGGDRAPGKLVVYDVEADRAETVASWKAGETGPEVYRLPSQALAESPYTYTVRADEEERQWEATWAHYVCLDSFTGRVVRPDPALGLVDARQFLIDIVGDRALVIYFQPNPAESLGRGRLTLFHGEERTDLGDVYATTTLHAVAMQFFRLSPDRDHIIWSGPDGTRIADLNSGQVVERRGAYSWVQPTRGWPHFNAGERVVDWLPDSSGRIEFRHDGDGVWHWEVFEPLGETPVGSGEGRADKVSPDVTHLLVYNDDAEAYGSNPLPPDVPPYFVRPLPRRATPGIPFTPDREGRARGWAAHGDDVSYFAEARVGETEMAVYRITPEGFTVLPIHLARPRNLTVLAVADGGRLGVWGRVGSDEEGASSGTSAQYETVIYDFAGQERLRLDGYPQATDPESGVFALVDSEGGVIRVTVMNALTGAGHTVPACPAKLVRVSRLGECFVAHTCQEEEGRGLADIYAGHVADAEWRLIAQGVDDQPRQVFHISSEPWARRRE